MYRGDLLHSSARFVRRDAYLAIGGLDERLIAGEDYDFQSRLDRGGYVTGFIEAEAVHLGEPRSLATHLSKYFRYGAQFVEYWRKNPKEARSKLGLSKRPYASHWRSFVERPGTGAAFVLYSLLKKPRRRVGVCLGIGAQPAVGRRSTNRPATERWCLIGRTTTQVPSGGLGGWR